MSNEKQTAGEWVFCNYVETKQGRIPTEIWSAGSGKGKRLATLHYDPKDPELSNEKVLANIKAMAASKELLEATMNLLHLATRYDTEDGKEDSRVTYAKAALKKATK